MLKLKRTVTADLVYRALMPMTERFAGLLSRLQGLLVLARFKTGQQAGNFFN